MNTAVTARRSERQTPVLEVRGICKRFGAVQALRMMSPSALYPGEVVGLIGDNGAGKSTLVNIIAGSLPPDSGEILVDGVERRFETAAQAREAGIETVFQYLSLIPTLDMAENVFLNREIFGFGQIGRWLRWMDKAEMRRQTSDGFTPARTQRCPRRRRRSPPSPADSGRRWQSPARSCGAVTSSSSTSRPRRWA